MRNISFWKITYHNDLKSPLNRFIKWLSDYCKRFELDFPSPSHSQKNLSTWDRLLHWPDSICSITPLFDTFLFHNDLVAPRPATMIQLTFARGCATSVTACSEQQAAVCLGATSPCFPKFYFAMQFSRAPSSYSAEVQRDVALSSTATRSECDECVRAVDGERKI